MVDGLSRNPAQDGPTTAPVDLASPQQVHSPKGGEVLDQDSLPIIYLPSKVSLALQVSS